MSQTNSDNKAKTSRENSGDQINRMIAEAAYYKAEERDFAPGSELQDWLAAEQEITEQSEVDSA